MTVSDRDIIFDKPAGLLAHAQEKAHVENLISVMLGLLQIAMTIALAYWVAATLNNCVYQSPFQLPGVSSWLQLAGILLIRSAAAFAQARAGNRASIKIRGYLRSWALDRTTRLNIRLYPTWQVAEVTNLLTSEIDKQVGYFAEYVAHRRLAIYMPVAVLIAAATVNWIVPLILLFTGPMMVVFMVLVGWKAADASRANLEQLNRLGNLLSDRLKNIQTLQLAGTTNEESSALYQQSEGYRRSTMRVLRVAFLSGTVLEFFSAVSIALVAVYLGLFFLGKYDVGSWSGLDMFEGVFLLMLAPEFYAPLRKMGALYHQKTDAETMAEAMIKLDTLERSLKAEASANVEPATFDALSVLEVDELQAGHSGIPAHAPVSFSLTPGHSLLLRGPSGSGKTTLLDTLAGLRPELAGVIRINDQAEHIFLQTDWFAQIGYMSQHAELAFSSIRENLCLGKDYCDEVLFNALGKANAEEVVRNLPEQLDYVISDSGARLSGGQAQRVALARVFLHRPSLLLLDEPTANLDEETAQGFMDNLAQYCREGGMVIMSSHLYSDHKFFDQIYDLEQRTEWD